MFNHNLNANCAGEGIFLTRFTLQFILLMFASVYMRAPYSEKIICHVCMLFNSPGKIHFIDTQITLKRYV